MYIEKPYLAGPKGIHEKEHARHGQDASGAAHKGGQARGALETVNSHMRL